MQLMAGRSSLFGHACIAFVSACGDAPRPAILTAVRAEPPSENCRYGGAAIASGIDANDDGELSLGEIQSTSYVCSQGSVGEDSGNFRLENSYDALVLSGFASAGDVWLEYTTMTSVSVPNLADVNSLFVLGNSSLASTSFPDLRTIRSGMTIWSNSVIRDLGGLPNLRELGGIRIESNAALRDVLSLCSVTAWVQSVQIVSNPALPTCNAEQLVACLTARGQAPGFVQISNNDDAGTCP